MRWVGVGRACLQGSGLYHTFLKLKKKALCVLAEGFFNRVN